MTTNYKVLGQANPLAGVETNLYSSPSQTLVRSINITNNTSSPDTYTIAIPSADVTHYLGLFSGNTNSPGYYYTSDGLTWTQSSSNIPNNNATLNPTIYINNKYVAGLGNALASSTDAINWTLNYYLYPNFIIYGNNKYVTHNQYSTDLITWSSIPLPSSGYSGTFYINSMIYFNNLYIATSQFNEVITSTDLITWSYNNLNVNFGRLIFTYSPLAVGNNKIMLVANLGYSISTDGINWSSFNYINNSQMIGSVFFNGSFYVSQANGNIISSTDGITWTIKTNNIIAQYAIEFFATNNFMIIVQNGQSSSGNYSYLLSTDGTTWTTNTIVIAPYAALGSPTTFSQKIATKNQDYIQYNQTIYPNETITIKSGYTLGFNNTIRVQSGSGNLTFSAYGAEIQ